MNNPFLHYREETGHNLGLAMCEPWVYKVILSYKTPVHVSAQNSGEAQLCARKENAAQEVSPPDYGSCQKMPHHKNLTLVRTVQGKKGLLQRVNKSNRIGLTKI